MTAETSSPSNATATRGFFFALTAYTLWGVQPIFMKMVAHIPATEVVAHRIVWSVPIAAIVLVALGRTADIKKALRSPRTLAMAAVTAGLITINWGIYVWAIAVDRTTNKVAAPSVLPEAPGDRAELRLVRSDASTAPPPEAPLPIPPEIKPDRLDEISPAPESARSEAARP